MTASLPALATTGVNVVVLVLRRDPVEHEHFRTPTALPIVGVVACVVLVLPWTSGRDLEQYWIAGALLALGLVLWVVTVLLNRASRNGAPDRDLTDVR